jgi:hypothetical protein
VLNKTLLAEDPRILSCKSVSSYRRNYEEGSKVEALVKEENQQAKRQDWHLDYQLSSDRE